MFYAILKSMDLYVCIQTEGLFKYHMSFLLGLTLLRFNPWKKYNVYSSIRATNTCCVFHQLIKKKKKSNKFFFLLFYLLSYMYLFLYLSMNIKEEISYWYVLKHLMGFETLFPFLFHLEESKKIASTSNSSLKW